ncbi:hypothetical protein GWO43_24275 [candidate division KSB1 bacterium]|nr:hypothetical protein [candidate division KSB1 bacterium]NIR69087.1 hypothetical protein [candidate division KSB1 bacterium]NIS27367.1 hypothetical protein [candidate division KSB1 bacterium]NIT73933.1 hypothetical protein [candidate division KSB1 bacterium]NIU28082.1 hypothetical protein [candidate division KSB1 bacterium]
MINFNTTAFFHILFSRTFERNNVKINWQSAPKDLPQPLLKEMDDYWRKATKQAPHLFDGKLCRLNDWKIEKNVLALDLGLTGYKELLYCNEHVQYVEAQFGAEWMSRALGISAILVSADGQLVLIERSRQVGEFPGCFDVLGGHIHPDDHAVSGKPDPFLAMEDELQEEIHLNLDMNEPMQCIGLIETTQTQKPELIFKVESGLSLEEILRSGSKNKSREIESFLSIAHDRNALIAFLNANVTQCSPSALGVMALYAQTIEDKPLTSQRH